MNNNSLQHTVTQHICTHRACIYLTPLQACTRLLCVRILSCYTMCPYTVMLHNVSVYCHATQRPFYENTSRILVIIWCTSLTCGVTGSSSRLWDNNVRIIIILFWTFFWFRIFIQYSIRLRMFWNMCRLVII